MEENHNKANSSPSEARYKHKSRITIEALMKATNISCVIYTIILHIYMAILLGVNGILPEVIFPTLIFDFCLFGGCILFWILAGKGQRGPILEWISFFIPNFVNAYFLIWQIEQFDLFTEYALYFPYNTILLWIWMILLLISLFYLLLVFLFSMIKAIQGKSSKNHSKLTVKKIIPIIAPMLLIALAFPIASWYVQEGTVKRVVVLEDTNMNATFSIWDFPKISAQVNNTQDIDLSKLTPEQNRTLIALGKMKTTFYGQISFSTPIQVNYTIAFLKLLQLYNLTVCATIWDEISHDFPGPAYPENWIKVARSTLEFVIANNLTNVIGFCSDSEAELKASPEVYWHNIALYDSFLQEVQTNASLRHPDPTRGKFETVLCFEPRALQDLMDNDTDLIFNRRGLGMPPFSWTKYHFMVYRLDPDQNTADLHNWNTLMKKRLGVNISAPIVGLGGVDWFSDGYFNDTCNLCNLRSQQKYKYDGIEGWAAMKREIFFSKAMGFHTVNVFHLNSYGNLSLIEGYGFLDYYGLEKVEELANEWNQPKNITYPISSMKIELKRSGLFNPNGEFVYDVQTNIEMYILRSVVTLVILFWPFYLLKISKTKKEK